MNGLGVNHADGRHAAHLMKFLVLVILFAVTFYSIHN